MLMHRQAPLAVGALAACAVIATGAVLLREQILTFASWPDAREARQGAEAGPQILTFDRHLLFLALRGDDGAAIAGLDDDARSHTVLARLAKKPRLKGAKA